MGRKSIHTAFLVVVPVFVALAAGVIFLRYQPACNFILEQIGKPDKLKELQSHFLTPDRFTLVKIILSALFLSLAIVSFLLSRKSDSIFSFCSFLFNRLKVNAGNMLRYCKRLDKSTGIVLLSITIISFAVSLFYALTVPVDVDEAFTYLNFTRNSIFISCSSYPAPNNHIFYSLLTNLTYHFPFSPLFNIRIINIVVSLIVLLLFFRLANKIFSPSSALVVTVLFHFSHMNLLYSFQGRGYELLLLFSLISVYCVLALTESYRGKYLFLYCIATVLGFYTMPSYLYCFLSLDIFLTIFWLRREMYRRFVSLIFYNVISGILIVILYLPVIYVSGAHSLFSNEYIKPVSRILVLQSLSGHFTNVLNEMTGLVSNPYSLPGLLLLIIFLVIGIFRGGDNSIRKRMRILCLCMMVLPPFFLLAQSVIPYARTWIYLTVPVSLSIGFLLDKVLLRFRNFYIMAAILFFLVALQTLNFNRFNRLSDQLNQPQFTHDYLFDKASSGVDFAGKKSISSTNVNYSVLLAYKISTANKSELPVTVVLNTLSPSFMQSDIVLLSNSKLQPDNMKYSLAGASGNLRIYMRKEQ